VRVLKVLYINPINKEYSMNRLASQTFAAVWVVGFLVCATPQLSMAVDAKPASVAGVDNAPMGAYRSLAQMSFEAFQAGDPTRAAKLARILERTWDKGEEYGGDRALSKKNKALFEQIDAAMDAFIKPIIHAEIKSPDLVATKAAYEAFVTKLSQADQ
jgi:hypothetical protein